MKIVKNPLPHQWESIFERPKLEQASLKNVIAEVFDQVKREKDQALYDYIERFDGVKLSQLTINKNELEQLASQVTVELAKALEVAYKNISTFHQAQLEKTESITTQQGVTCWRKSVAIDTVGLYIPGGSAPLFSSLMMLAIPAKIAGSRKIIICTPPQKGDYIVHPAIAWTALKCGIDTVYTVGGSQAIAAMSLGTESIEKCSSRRIYK